MGERLKAFREARGLSQEALGDLLNVKGPTISRYETNDSQIKANDLPRFAEALGVTPAAFFVDEDDHARSLRVDRFARHFTTDWDEWPETERGFFLQMADDLAAQFRRYRTIVLQENGLT